MPKFKILVTVVAIWCSPVQLATANTVVLGTQTLALAPTARSYFAPPTDNPNAEPDVEVVLGSSPAPEPSSPLGPTPAPTPPVNSLMLMLLRRFGY
jgi:hypothetical protein